MIKINNKKNKVALITGAAKRLGKEIAVTIAKQGYDIVLNYFTSKKSEVESVVNEIKQFGVSVYPVKADVSKVAEIKKMFKVVRNNFNSLDVLVNNASIFGPVDFFDIDEKIFDKFISTNLKSALFCSIEAAKLMTETNLKQGKIINIASLGGIQNWTQYIPYTLAKSSVIKLTAITAKRLAPGILVNAIAPGIIVIENDENRNVNPDDEMKFPMKRFGKAEDISSLIRFLINENDYITGQTFVVDGGKSL